MKLIHAVLSLAVAAALPLRAQTITETFDGNSLPSSLQVVAGSEYAFPTGSMSFSGAYTIVPEEGDNIWVPIVWVATNFSGYYDLSITAEVVFRTGPTPEEFARFQFGIGTLSSFSTDRWPGPEFIGIQFESTEANGLVRFAHHGPTEFVGGAILGYGSTSTGESLARIVWNGTTKTATFLVDIGNDGTFDVTSSAINGADNGYTASNLRIGFGGGLGSYVTSFSVAPTAVPEPSTYALWAGLAACACGLLRRRTRRV